MNNNGKIEVTDAVLMAYITDELSASDRIVVSRWIESTAENKTYFKKVEKAWETSGQVDPKPVVVDTNKAWGNVLQGIQSKETEVVPLKSNRKIYLAIAAMVVVMLGVFSIIQFMGGAENLTLTATSTVLSDELIDGSKVKLNINSSLTYPEEFAAHERRVTLEGEAFFDIARNEEKPFIIDLPAETYVKVLGTSFNINAAYEDSLTEVVVSTGKVEFGSADTSIILLPGEKGIYNKATGQISKESNAATGIKEMMWISGELNFDHVPLYEVLEILNDVYDDSVLLGCENLKDLSIRTHHNIDEDSMEDVLKIIAEVHGLKVQFVGAINHKNYVLNCND